MINNRVGEDNSELKESLSSIVELVNGETLSLLKYY
jgi:hypothetical protein